MILIILQYVAIQGEEKSMCDCQVRFETNEEICIVSLEGEFVLGSTGEIKEHVKSYVEEHQVSVFIVDLSRVSFMDSSGLGALIAWFKMANEKQGRVVFCSPTDYVRKIIGYAKLDKIFTIKETRTEAEICCKA